MQGALTCGRNLLIVIQFSLTFANYLFIYALVAAWIKNPSAHSKERCLTRLSFTLHAIWIILGGGALTGYYIWALGPKHDITQVYFKVLSYTALVTVVLQWIPQIWTSWKLKSSGSLSIFTLILNVVGCAVTVFVVIASHRSVELWIPYAASGIQQVLLVAMLVFFIIRERAARMAGKLNGIEASVSVSINTSAHEDDDAVTKSLLSSDSYDSDAIDHSRALSFSGDELTPAYKFYQGGSTGTHVPPVNTYKRIN